MTIKSKVPNDKYRDEWERIFGKNKPYQEPNKAWADAEAAKDYRRSFEYPPIEELDKPDTYKQDQKH